MTRKKVLLRLLALREARRVGIEPSPREAELFVTQFRREYRLEDDAALETWLALVGLSRERFRHLLTELLVVLKMEQHLEGEIEGAEADQRAVWTAHRWARGAAR